MAQIAALDDQHEAGSIAEAAVVKAACPVEGPSVGRGESIGLVSG